MKTTFKIRNSFVNGDVKDVKRSIKGAQDIIAGWINESTVARNNIRQVFIRDAYISATVIKEKEEEGNKYQDYFHVDEPLQKCSSHRLLAIRRGETEGFLKVSISPRDEEKCIQKLMLFL